MKHKNSDLVPFILMSAAGVVILGIIIFFMISKLNSTKDAAEDIFENTEKIASELEEYSITKYDGEEIKGSQVRNFIKEHLGDYTASETASIYVQVTTVVNGTTYTNIYINKQHISEIKDFARNQYYIKPTAKFTCEIVKSANKAILGINFSQK